MNKNLQKIFRYLSLAESESDAEWEKWFVEHEEKLKAGKEIEPPWIAFPNSSPIHGWNQGYQEAWKNNVWVIFWNKLNNTEKADYLHRWKLPSEEWRETVMIYWK